MLFHFSSLTPENLPSQSPTGHYTTPVPGSGTWVQSDLCRDKVGSIGNTSKKITISASIANGTIVDFRGTSWFSEPLKKGILGTGAFSFDLWTAHNITTAGLITFLNYGIFIVDADNNLKTTIQNKGTISFINSAKTNYTWNYNLGSLQEIEFGDRLVFEFWVSVLNVSGSTIAINKGAFQIDYNNNFSTQYDSHVDFKHYSPKEDTTNKDWK